MFSDPLYTVKFHDDSNTSQKMKIGCNIKQNGTEKPMWLSSCSGYNTSDETESNTPIGSVPHKIATWGQS